MIKIKSFSETNFEFSEIARIYNLISHDFKDHPDDVKERWDLRDKNLITDRLLLFANDVIVGYVAYTQGRKENKQNCYFNIYLDPSHNGKGYRQLLFDYMLNEVLAFDCNQCYADVYEHSNYDNYKKFLEKNGFHVGLKIREYSLKLDTVDFVEYAHLLEKLDEKGIKFHDAREDMRDFPDHYEKLEELEWTYGQDFPMPEGIVHTRTPFDLWMKQQKSFEKKHYGTQIVAVDDGKYIGATDIVVFPKSDPHKAWTGGLGVIKEYRRQGVATAIKIKAFEQLLEKGIKEVRTDNEENNPMYKINVALGFVPEPYGIEYQKKI